MWNFRKCANFKYQLIIRLSKWYIRPKVLCAVCNIASRGKCWKDGFEEGRGGWRMDEREGGETVRESFNKSMNIVNSSTVRSRIISTLSENNYTLSGRICLSSCPPPIFTLSQGGVSNRSIIFPPRSSGHCLLNRTLRRYSGRSLRE